MNPLSVTAILLGLVALATALGLLWRSQTGRVREIASGETVARLEDPHGDRAAWLALTSDAGRLVVVAPYARAVHVWDLHALRRRLRPMKLDWD